MSWTRYEQLRLIIMVSGATVFGCNLGTGVGSLVLGKTLNGIVFIVVALVVLLVTVAVIKILDSAQD